MNLPTLIICIIIAAAVILVITYIVKERKKGELSCGMSCGGCSGSCGKGKHGDGGKITNPEALRIMNEELQKGQAEAKGAKKK